MSNSGPKNHDTPASLSSEEFDSLLEVSRGDAQCDIPQPHRERLVAPGFALRRLGVLGLTEAGIRRLDVPSLGVVGG